MEKKSKYKLGLIGYPIEHSQSPAFFKDNHPEVSYDLIQTSNFKKAISIFKKDYFAINVTTPFKELAYDVADTYDLNCKKIGATNLLIKKENKIFAFNTDRDGAMRSIWKAIEINASKNNTLPLTALVIGLGGAGKAATVAALDMGLKTTIVNRSQEKCPAFIARLQKLTRALPSWVDYCELEKAIKENDIIIYTLPGSIPNLNSFDFSQKIVIEANYRNPSLSKTKTATYIGGSDWLQYQAIEAWKTISSY